MVIKLKDNLLVLIMKRILIHVFENPKIVAPNTIVKLKANVNAKWPVDAKL